jgi:hypothetical protein
MVMLERWRVLGKVIHESLRRFPFVKVNVRHLESLTHTRVRRIRQSLELVSFTECLVESISRRPWEPGLWGGFGLPQIRCCSSESIIIICCGRYKTWWISHSIQAMLSAERIIFLSILRNDLLAQNWFGAVLFDPCPRSENLLLMKLFVLVHDVLYLHIVHIMNLIWISNILKYNIL